ncbi:MAG: uracil-DNA glycosylase [Actinobacteria bacterium]|nr:uracil-DNA glycosylase [Actinomycetota bacterium]
MTWLDVVHPSWNQVFTPHLELIQRVESQISKSDICPSGDLVFRAFSAPLSEMKVVVFGQDPYPNVNQACGLAFAVPTNVHPLPKSLLNIFSELQHDLGGTLRTNGDLSDWANQGVGLINRVLTVPIGNIGAHSNSGWQELTDGVARILGERGVVAILWGNHARQLEKYFPPNQRISSSHPSPLSAYRGFFGSRPFSRANQLLAVRDELAIDWLSTDTGESN